MFSNLKLRTKLAFGFGLNAALLIVIVWGANNSLSRINENIENILGARLSNYTAAYDLQIALLETARHMRNVLILDDKDKIKAEIESIRKRQEERKGYLEFLQNKVVTEEGKKAVAAIAEARQAYLGPEAEFVRLAEAGKLKEAKAELLERARPLQLKYRDKVGEFIKVQKVVMKEDGGKAKMLGDNATFMMLLLGVIALAVSVLAGYLITRNLMKLLGGEPGDAAGIANKVAAGDLTAKIELRTGDATSVMAAMQNMMLATQALVNDTHMLSAAAAEGRLQTRADAGKHQGDFRKIVQGVNDTLDGVILPVSEAVEVLTLVEQGDLTRTVNGDYKGQLGDFKDTVNSTIAKLSQTIAEVVSSAEQLGNASEQISATSQSLSQASSEQAASVEETSASIEQMAASINQNSENAKVTDGMAGKTNKEAIEGGVAVKQTVEAMKDIANKIGIIDDIAYQTNMLALNAAIEAARAGDHGKGFAVVAAEVRKLAERSQIAAQEIGELAETSVKTAESAGQLLDAIVPSIAKTSDLVQEIAAASQEQSSGVSQINTAMNQMNQITQQNASASEELAATAEEMTSQAEQLQTLMSFFKIAGNDTAFSRAVPKGSIKAVKAKPVLQVRRDRADAEVDLNQFERF